MNEIGPEKTIPMLGSMDVLPDFTYYPLAVFTCAVFIWMFKYTSPSLSVYIYPGFYDLTDKEQVYWITSVHSTIHAIITSSMCLYAILYEDGLLIDPIWYYSPIVKCSCAIVVGYMTSDAIIMVWKWDKMKDIGVLMHHLASVYAYYYVMTYGVFVYFANFRLMAEFSTPWVNNRWLLSTMKVDKSGKVYMINGVVLTAVFFACRILSMPWCWYKIYELYGTEPFIRTGYIQYVLVISCIVLDYLNIKWFVKLVKGVIKTLTMNADANRNVKEVKSD